MMSSRLRELRRETLLAALSEAGGGQVRGQGGVAKSPLAPLYERGGWVVGLFKVAHDLSHPAGVRP